MRLKWINDCPEVEYSFWGARISINGEAAVWPSQIMLSSFSRVEDFVWLGIKQYGRHV
jgi:hypothetical protein